MASVPGTHASVVPSSAPLGAPSDDAATGPLVSVVMGSDSDWNVMVEASAALTEFGIRHEVEVVSAHRTPKRMIAFGSEAAARGIRVIIAGAGGAAHLPGMLASVTTLPVIGVPVPLAKLDGLDSLLSIVQMPAGIPVATVSIGGARNAGLLAARILSISDPALAARLEDFAAGLEALVIEKNAKLQRGL
jgi:5-(carboxyamino)imidazole ribonucleotide mutase